jgi:hypothetical protein
MVPRSEICHCFIKLDFHLWQILLQGGIIYRLVILLVARKNFYNPSADGKNFTG